MIKSVGFGRKASGISHEESCRYHREVHAPLARGAIGRPGLEKYIGRYVDEAFSLDGKALPELPWDMVVFEWLTDEFWKGMEVWRNTTPEGTKVKEDEARFCDPNSGMMLLCEENVIVSPEGGSTGINVIFLLTKRSDMSHEECVKYHREMHAPRVARVLGSRLKSYVAHYVDQAVALVSLGGTMPTRPYDIIVVTRFDNESWKGMEAWRKTPEGIKITEDEELFIDRKSAIALVCHESVYVP